MVFPLIRDAFAILESSKCEFLSVSDLKDEYHTIKLSEISKPYFGILPYFGLAIVYTKEFPWDYVQVQLYDKLR